MTECVIAGTKIFAPFTWDYLENYGYKMSASVRAVQLQRIKATVVVRW
jgi:hypothetical protein